MSVPSSQRMLKCFVIGKGVKVFQVMYLTRIIGSLPATAMPSRKVNITQRKKETALHTLAPEEVKAPLGK